MNIRQLTAELANDAAPRAELRLLLTHVLARSTAWLAAHDDYELTPAEESNVRIAVSRRVAGEPIAYILGYREFYGRKFKCTPAALIPRPETELLIDQVVASVPSPWGGGLGRGYSMRESGRTAESTVDAVWDKSSSPTRGSERTNTLSPTLPPGGREPSILDVGTGTGCIAITLALELPNAQVTAIDVSRDALALARENARILGATNVEFIESDWFTSIVPSKKFDVIVSNPPYIAPNDPHLFRGDLRFEPWLALRDRVDGLESYRELVKGAKKHLRDGALLIVEHGYDQGESVPALFREAGFVDVEMIRDLAGNPRVTRALFLTSLSSS